MAGNALSDPEWLMLVLTLIGHQRMSPGRCGCGWSAGDSHARHVADTYGQMLATAARRDQPWPAQAGLERS